MVARGQDLGNLQPAKLGGSRVVRSLQEAVLEGADGRYLSPDVTWQGKAAPVPTREQAEAMISAAAEGGEALGAWMQGRLPKRPQYAPLVEAVRRYEDLYRSLLDGCGGD